MRIALAAERSRANAHSISQRIAVSDVQFGHRDVLRVATQGAGARRLDGEVDSMTPGKRADIPIVDLRQPHLDGVGDPVFAMLMGAAPADVHTVIVDGEVLKSESDVIVDP
jgi:5-methylthioadenosine/S-adenosylhomocysteine deaminase